MKLVPIVTVCAIAGVGATMYAGPGAGRYDDSIGRAVELQNRMKDDLAQIIEVKSRAGRSRDILKVNCVNDKLVQAKPIMNAADHFVLDVEAANTRADGVGGLDRLNRAAEEMRQLREGAKNCVDSSALGTESSNSFSHPEFSDILGTNPVPGGYIEPPIYASPVR